MTYVYTSGVTVLDEAKLQQKRSEEARYDSTPLWGLNHAQAAAQLDKIYLYLKEKKLEDARKTIATLSKLISKMKTENQNLQATDANGKTLLQRAQAVAKLIKPMSKELADKHARGN